MLNFLKQKRNIIGIFNLLLSLLFILISILHFTSDKSQINGIFLVYLGLMFLVLGIGTIRSKVEFILYSSSYLTILLLMSILSVHLIRITDYNAIRIGIIACVIGLALMYANERTLDKVIAHFHKKKELIEKK
jgi:drug/metabolite transporter (DMT)-like permease